MIKYDPNRLVEYAVIFDESDYMDRHFPHASMHLDLEENRLDLWLLTEEERHSYRVGSYVTLMLRPNPYFYLFLGYENV